ncbi:MAG: hypothetical protein Q8S75_07390, partial [Nitrospirota bacterium]|nr:hypothetical protein [Nitrospirota bacterium]
QPSHRQSASFITHTFTSHKKNSWLARTVSTLPCISKLAHPLLIRIDINGALRGHPNKEGIEMDFAATLIVSNTLMAAVIYLVVTWIWED